MQTPDYIECGFVDNYVDVNEEIVVVYVHRNDDSLIVFNDVKSDPVISKGWFCIEHTFVNQRLNSQVLASQVKYISYTTQDRTKGTYLNG